MKQAPTTTTPLAPAVDFHEQLAPRWNAKYAGGIFEQRSRKLSQVLQRAVQKGELWVDAGCGTGTLSRLVLGLGGTIIGLDASPSMIDNALQQTAEPVAAGSARFQVIPSIEQIPLPSESVDGVICSSVLEYVTSPESCVAEFARLLKPGGKLILTVPHRRSLVRIVQKMIFRLTGLFTGRPRPEYLKYSVNHFSAGEFRRLLDRHGFSTEPIEFTSFWPAWIPLRPFGGLCLYAGQRTGKTNR